MRGDKRRRRLWVGATGWLLLAPLYGCTGSIDFGTEPGFASIASLGAGGRIASGETQPNDSFDTPSPFRLVDGQARSIEGVIHATSDVDVYDIGPLHAGDRLIVDLSADAWLDTAAAVFDNAFDLIYLNDDRNFFTAQFDPYIDFVMRHDSDRCFIVVSPSPTGMSTGNYTLTVTRTPGADAPSPQPQVVLFNFDGAQSVAFGGRIPVDVEPFDATVVSPALAGKTDQLIDLILERVREDYQGLNVEFHTSRERTELQGPFSTVHFGAFDPGLLGVAESVDEFNESTVQEAIVFADTFEVFNALQPTLEEYAQAFANVASHETGHLLGLVHSKDTHGIMDITASLRQLTRNQAFSRSPIERSAFPIGSQDAVVSLLDAVGGDLQTVRLNSAAQLAQAKLARSFENVDLPDGPRVIFSTCTRPGCHGKRLKPPRRPQ